MTKHAVSWNAYPALLAALCFGAGICAAEWLRLPAFWMILIAAACTWGIWSSLSSRVQVLRLNDLVLTTSALVIVAAGGGIRSIGFESIPPGHIVDTGFGREIDVSGWIIDVQSANRFVLHVDPPHRGLLLVSVRDPAAEFRTCDVARMRGKLAELPSPRNPGDFDYGSYLRRKRIYARLFADEALSIGRRRSGITCVAAETRAAIGARIDRYLTDPQARGVLRALLLGDRRAIDRSVRDQFARTGLLHLLAVSGLHVMVVGMILYRLLRPTLMRAGLSWRAVEIARTLLTTILLVAYMVLAGGSASVVRAVVMAVLFMMAAAMQRNSDSMNTLGAAALILLAARPAHLFEPGFQLSMAAVAAIIALTPQLEAWMPAPSKKSARYVHSSLTVTTAATIGTLPVVVTHFGQAALGGLLLNLPAIPLTTAVLVSGIAAVATGELAASFGVTLGASADVLSRSLIAVSEWGDRHVGWSLIRWSIDHPAPVISISLSVLAVARWRAPHHRWPLVLASIAVITIHSWVEIAERRWLPSLQVLFLDVGQGDAAVMLLPEGEAAIIDAGPRTAYVDAGADLILPQLERLGIRRIHTVVITHPDSDHLGGLPSILRAMPVARVIRSGFVHDSDLYRETNHILDSLNIPQRTVRAGDTLSFGSGVRAYVLHPTRALRSKSPNDHSIVIQVIYGSSSILVTGDAPLEAELEMVRVYGEILKSRVLKVGHHGSRTSSTSAFLSSVYSDGAVSLVSVAARNRFGLPDEDVIERLHRTGFAVHSTANSGALWLRLDGTRVSVVDF